jgi:AraC-like DNA-binding protein
MHCHLYSIRDAPQHETFRAQLREIGMEIVHWDAPIQTAEVGGAVPPDFLVYSSRELIMFALCSTPHTQAAQIDTRVREDRISIRVGLLTKGGRTYQIGKDRVEIRGLDLALVYQEKGKVVRGSGTAPERSISIMIKPSVLKARLGDRLAQLPAPVRDVILGKRAFHRESRVTGRLMSVMSSLDDLLTMSPMFLDIHAEATAISFLAAAFDTFSASALRTAGPSAAEAARLEGVRSLIEENPARHYDVEELGRMAAMNRTKLRAAFKQIYGMTLSDYQTASRMRLAERRLRATDLSLEAVAHEVGYANAASFVVAYKAFFGSTPGRARRRTASA